MFPHVMQALHVYEPRYRAMIEEAVESDRLIALGVLALGGKRTTMDGLRCDPLPACVAWPRTSGPTKAPTTCCS